MAENAKRLVWDETGKRIYETGVKMAVLYVQGSNGEYGAGVPWNGLTSVSESPSGAEATPLYANDSKYLSLYSVEEFGGSIEAYTYPEEFEQCDGSAQIATGVTIGQQNRKAAGLCYRTTVGNDTEGNDYGYKIHIVYGMRVSPSQKAFATINNSPEAISMSWEFTTTPVPIANHKPSATLIIDSTKVDAGKLKELEDILYGKDPVDGSGGSAARLPMPDEIAQLFAA